MTNELKQDVKQHVDATEEERQTLFADTECRSSSDVIPIVDKGVVYPPKKIERKKHQRTTKEDIHKFVRWLFKHNDDEAFNKLSSGKISNLYLNETGTFINRETVRRNRKIWQMKDGKIVNTENEFGNVINEK